jgi:hypothetical protein
MTTHIYTGVGSRETPGPILATMSDIAEALARAGYILRSGAADGADHAFEIGAQRVPAGSLEIYLPWKGFNGSTSLRYVVTEAALALAETVHPHWAQLKDPVRKLHARNCYQVLGETLLRPAEFLICWTPDGCESELKRTRSTGGTATAIVLAQRNNIPIFNLQRKDSQARIADFLKTRSIPMKKGFDRGYQADLF